VTRAAGVGAVRRLALPAVGAAALYFAVFGGEYSTMDLLRQRGREATLRQAIDSLKRDIDSLRVLGHRIQNDPATIERIAREAHGMVRGDRELLYRFVAPESLRAR
jgi:cell division protein FtsB